MATSILKGLSKITEEDLMFQERAVEPKVDGIFGKMYDTSEGVVMAGGRPSSNTAGFEVLHTFATGTAGAFRNIAGGGDATSPGAGVGQVDIYNPSESFPGIADTVAPGYIQKKIILVEGLGLFALPLHLLMQEAQASSITKPVSLTIKGTAKKIAQSEAISLYKTSHVTQAVFTITTKVTSGANTNVAGTGATFITVTFTGTSDIDGRVGRLLPGMVLDLFNSSGTKKNAAGGTLGADVLLVVGNVDYVNRQVQIYTSDGVTLVEAADIANGDYFTLYNSGGTSGVGIGPAGIDYWTTDANYGSTQFPYGATVFGIDFSVYSQFKSIVASVNNVLDQATLDRYVGAFYDAYADMCDLDSAITTAGVINNYIENLDGLFRYERNNMSLKLKEGWSTLDYEYNGRSFELLVSRYVKNGNMYFIKTKEQNIKRYNPARVSGAGKKEGFVPEVQWYAPLAGSNTIFLPATNTAGKIVRYLQAPFFLQREVCPEQLQGIKLQGLTELFV